MIVHGSGPVKSNKGNDLLPSHLFGLGCGNLLSKESKEDHKTSLVVFAFVESHTPLSQKTYRKW